MPAVGHIRRRRHRHPDGGDNCAALQRAHDNDGDGVGVGDMVNHEGNAVDVSADGKRKLSVAFHVFAAVTRTTPDKLSRRALRRRGARLSLPRHRQR